MEWKGKIKKGKSLDWNEVIEKLILICFWYDERKKFLKDFEKKKKTKVWEKNFISEREILEILKNRQNGSNGHSIWNFIQIVTVVG